MASASAGTPSHSLPRTEYPFDDHGNYIATWAAIGEERFGHKLAGESYANHSPSSAHRSVTHSRPVTAAATPRTSPKASSSPKPSAAPPKKSLRYHKVTASDTLFALSRQYGTSVEAIQQINKLNGTVIITGSTIKIPG